MADEITQRERGLTNTKKKHTKKEETFLNVIGHYLSEEFTKRTHIKTEEVYKALVKQQQESRERQQSFDSIKKTIKGWESDRRRFEIQAEKERLQREADEIRATQRSAEYHHSSDKLPGATINRDVIGRMQESAQTGDLKLFKDAIEDVATNAATDGIFRAATPVVGGIISLAKNEFKLARKLFNGRIQKAFAKRLGLKKWEQVHHAIELQTLERYPGVFSGTQLNDYKNLRGIPNELDGLRQLHNSKIRYEWDRHYKILDKQIEELGLVPGTYPYNKHVQRYLESARDEIDYIIGNFFVENRKNLGLR